MLRLKKTRTFYKMSSFKPIYKLRDWIDINKLSWSLLSGNPNAIKLLEQNPD